MELIRPSVEIWEQGDGVKNMWKHIAKCTRVCYQSIPKNNGETDEEFVKRVILRTDSSTGGLNFDKIHGAMLEHGTVYLKLENKPYNAPLDDEYYNTIRKYRENKYSKMTVIPTFVCKNEAGNVYTNAYYITTNLRVIYENNWLDDLKYLCTPTEYHFKRVTVSFITNIGVSREFNRHRVNSMAEESTRYCNYSLGKFDNKVTFVKPAWFDRQVGQTLTGKYIPIDCKGEFTQEERRFIESLSDAERAYLYLLKCGWKPQQAREVLPLATKTQLIHTAFVDDWKHFFALRADGVSGSPHPNAKLVAEALKKEFIKRKLL